MNISKGRTISGNDTLTYNDAGYVLNDTTGGTWTLQLPTGVNGLAYRGSIASTNTGIFSLVPSGTDTLDGNLIYAHGMFQFVDGVWYAVA